MSNAISKENKKRRAVAQASMVKRSKLKISVKVQTWVLLVWLLLELQLK
jgi:hypothetical protein